jgi:hypothetical protein
MAIRTETVVSLSPSFALLMAGFCHSTASCTQEAIYSLIEMRFANARLNQSFHTRPLTLKSAPRRGSVATRGLVLDNTASVLAKGLHAVIRNFFVARGGKKSPLPIPSKTVIIVRYISPQEGEGKDVDGKRSYIETGPCMVVNYQFVDVSGQYQNFTRMAPAGFELLI